MAVGHGAVGVGLVEQVDAALVVDVVFGGGEGLEYGRVAAHDVRALDVCLDAHVVTGGDEVVKPLQKNRIQISWAFITN